MIFFLLKDIGHDIRPQMLIDGAFRVSFVSPTETKGSQMDYVFSLVFILNVEIRQEKKKLVSVVPHFEGFVISLLLVYRPPSGLTWSKPISL